MRKDTKSFLLSVFGVPVLLGGVWGFHDANEAGARTITFDRTFETPKTEPEESVSQELTTAPIAQKSAPGPSTSPKPTPISQPVVVNQPVVNTPVVSPKPTPAPAPKVVKKVRRTRAS